MRTSTSAASVAPMRWTRFSSMARSSLGWMLSGMVAISSRKMVPPSATSNWPGFSRSAPEKAPRVWPNSSLSTSVSGRAAQLTATNRPAPVMPL